MINIKKALYAMFSKPLRKKYQCKNVVKSNKTKKLPDSDYDGMGDFSRFGNPPK